MTEVDAFAEFAHDLRGAMGSLRLVISSLLDEDEVEQRRLLLNLADEEVQRVAATASALPALAIAAADRSTPVSVDLDGAIAAAVAASTRYGVRATPPALVSGSVLSRPAVLALVLPAVIQLAAGATGATSVTAEAVAGGVALTCTCGPLWPQARHLFTRLAEAGGGRAIEADGMSFVLPGAP